MTKIRQSFKYFFIIFTILLFSCSPDDKGKSFPEYAETMNSGKLFVCIDSSISELISQPLDWYKTAYPKVELTYEVVSSRKSMQLLLSGDARAVVVARDYIKDEDSLMQAYNVKKHERFIMATDAIVFFTVKDFPLDTLNDLEIKSVLTEGTDLRSYYPKLEFEPELVISNLNSSEYANLRFEIAADKLSKELNLQATSVAVVDYVRKNPKSIGITLLSRVYQDSELKLLKIGFYDSTNKYIRPKPVHQSYIVQGLYPYSVKLYVYLLSERRDLPFWFGKYLSIEEKVQRYFLKSGIVPEFAKIVIIPEEG